MTRLVLLMLVIGSINPAWAVNKCTGADGKVSFQDMPCSGRGEALDVRPATGSAQQPQPSSSQADRPSAPPKTEAQRINEQVEQSRNARRLQELELVELPRVYSIQSQQRASCDAQIQSLRRDKGFAKNNLAGATWEQSLSTEMIAIASRCETRGREIQADIDQLRKECHALGGCK